MGRKNLRTYVGIKSRCNSIAAPWAARGRFRGSDSEARSDRGLDESRLGGGGESDCQCRGLRCRRRRARLHMRRFELGLQLPASSRLTRIFLAALE